VLQILCTKLTHLQVYHIVGLEALHKERKPSAIIINVRAEILQGNHYEQNLEASKTDQILSIYTKYLTIFWVDALSNIHGH
jgi:hypothetical protein